jgi:hypothetical protein
MSEAGPRRGYHRGRRIWFEATSPTCGDPNSPDYIFPPPSNGRAYDVPNEYIEKSWETLKAVGSGYHFRDHIVKTPKDKAEPGADKKEPAKVSTGVFQDKEHSGLSALLCSRIHAASRHGEFGDDFQLVPNLRARVPLPEEFRLRGTYYAVEMRQDGYDVTPIDADAPPHFRFDKTALSHL